MNLSWFINQSQYTNLYTCALVEKKLHCLSHSMRNYCIWVGRYGKSDDFLLLFKPLRGLQTTGLRWSARRVGCLADPSLESALTGLLIINLLLLLTVIGVVSTDVLNSGNGANKLEYRSFLCVFCFMCVSYFVCSVTFLINFILLFYLPLFYFFESIFLFWTISSIDIFFIFFL